LWISTDFRRFQAIDFHKEPSTQKLSLGSVSLDEEAIWTNQWTHVLLNFNAPGNSPRELEAKQLSFTFLVKAYFIRCAPWQNSYWKARGNGQKCALNKTLLQPMSLCSCSLSRCRDKYKEYK
jgi:hypothetical protein